MARLMTLGGIMLLLGESVGAFRGGVGSSDRLPCASETGESHDVDTGDWTTLGGIIRFAA